MRDWRTSAVTGASGIGFGLLTWSIAHVVTLLSFAHIHPGFVVHYHGWVGPLAIAALMLTVTSLVAVGANLVRPPVSGPRLSLASGTLAPAAFVAVEFVEYFTGVHEAPPAALLIIGCLVHALIGVASPALWFACLEHAHRHATRVFTSSCPSTAIAVRAVARIWATGDTHIHLGSRAPPAGRGTLAPAL